MNLFGLEGCGFILSLSVTLLLAGLTFYYFRARCAVLERVVQEQNKILQQFIHASTICEVPLQQQNIGGGANEIAIQTVQGINNEWKKEEPMSKQEISDEEDDSDTGSDTESDSDVDSDAESNVDSDTDLNNGVLQLQTNVVPIINISNENDLQVDSIKTINLNLSGEPNDIITGACESLEQNENKVSVPDISNLTVPALRELVVEHTDISEKEAKKLLKPALKEILEPIVNN
jgi:hypothetical protein